MAYQSTDFNLLDALWIPVLWNNGKVNRVNIKTVLSEAENIRDIAASNPMDRFAVIRFLLALLYWCRGNPPDNFDATSLIAFPEEWFTNLDENKDCFNLLGGSKRLYQDPKTQRERPITDLVQEVPTGNNFQHFCHSTDYISSLCLSCCTLGLLRLPLFSVSGLPDLKSGINGSPPVYVLPIGKTLLQTLLLNWMPVQEIGTPSWISSQPRLGYTEKVPLLNGMTALSRRIWLNENSTSHGPCISCGSQEGIFLRTCELQSAGTQETQFWNDPHVIYYSDGKMRLSHRTSNLKDYFRMDRPWNDLLLRMIANKELKVNELPITIHIIGFSTNKADNIDVWERLVTVNNWTDIDVELIDQWKRKSSDKPFSFRMSAINAGISHRNFTSAVSTVASIRPNVEDKVSGRIDELLMGGIKDWQEAAKTWDPLLDAAAGSLSPGYTTNALEKQQRIREARPNITPPTVKENTELDLQGGEDNEHA